MTVNIVNKPNKIFRITSPESTPDARRLVFEQQYSQGSSLAFCNQ
jgi:hypothetical protein